MCREEACVTHICSGIKEADGMYCIRTGYAANIHSTCAEPTGIEAAAELRGQTSQFDAEEHYTK